MIPLSVAFISSPGAPHSHRYPDTQIPSAITFITKPCQLHLLAPHPTDTVVYVVYGRSVRVQIHRHSGNLKVLVTD